MLEINLLPVREARRKADLRQLLMQLLLVLIVTGGGIGMAHSRLLDQATQARGRASQMEADIEQFKPQLDQVAAFRRKKAQLEKKIDVIDGLDRARTGPVRVMAELSNRTPDRLWVTSLKSKGKTISIRGRSLDNELVALFLRGLGESPYFEDVDLDSTELGAERNGLRLITFAIRAVLADPRAPADSAKAKG